MEGFFTWCRRKSFFRSSYLFTGWLSSDFKTSILWRLVAALTLILPSFDRVWFVCSSPQLQGFLEELCSRNHLSSTGFFPGICTEFCWHWPKSLSYLREFSLRRLTLKTLFLVELKSVRWVLERVGGLSGRGDLCILHKNKMVLRTDSTF